MAMMPIERGKVREYAIATAAACPEFLDDPRAPIPPTFLSTVVFWDDLNAVLHSTDAVEACREAGIASDVTRLLSAEQEYLFFGPLPRVGDTLMTATRFDGVEQKTGRGGQMVFVRFAVEFRSPDGGLRAECRYTSVFVPEGSTV